MGAVAGKRILVVEDERKIIDILRLYLEREGFEVFHALTGREARDAFKRLQPDLVVLDLNLPDEDGLEVCRALRKDSSVPILMLTARDEEVDRVVGLELGADDYVTKPFSPREVVARVKAVLRRGQPPAQPREIRAGRLTLDLEKYSVRCCEQAVELTPTEFKLLSVLAQQPGRVFTRMQFLDQVQGEAFEGYERTIDAHVKNLRQKLSPLGCDCIVTVRGVGYKLEVGDAPACP